MRFWRSILAVLVSFGFVAFAHAAEHAGATHEAEVETGLPAAAPVLFHVGPLPVSNSMVATWLVGLALIAGSQLAMRKARIVPVGWQNFWEWLVEGLYGFLEGIIGSHLVKKTFWFFATLFIFIAVTNWCGLIPGVGTIGYGVQTAHGFHVTDPLFRGVHADFNMTFAMSCVFFILWLIWAIQENGVLGFLKHLFAPKGDTTGPVFLLMVVVFFAVGLLEIVSIIFRPVSLSFRLYGNIFAGENMIETMTHMGGPALGWLIALPFYGLEVLVGGVQALVFTLLTAVFTLLICSHDEEEGHGHKAHADAH